MKFHARVLLVLAFALPLGSAFASGCGGGKSGGTLSSGTLSSGTSSGGGHGGGGTGGTKTSSSTGSGAADGGTGGGTGTSSGTGAGDGGTGGADGGTGGADGGTSTSSSSGSSFDGGCLNLGAVCTTQMDCCQGNCVISMGAMSGVCEPPPCISDGKACTSSASCCGGNCTGGTCKPINTQCKSLGNMCGPTDQCCSGLCFNGLCSASSFCTQLGDSCTTSLECCSGTCTIAAGMTVGTCTPTVGNASNCGLTDGSLCGGTSLHVDGGITYADAGVPACGGACCSRACAPYGPTGVLICQPASGCHVVGDLCTQDSDCCGSAGLPGEPNKPVTCNITPPSVVGVCRNPIGCKPDGDVCKLATMSCNASCDCCSGNCENFDTCHQDSIGVPRCSPAVCVMPGGSCASSASCCNTLPCVPNPIPGGMPPYVCYQGGTCVPNCGLCTINADCCPGETCVVPIGSTHGTCGPCNPPPDGGTDSGTDSGTDGGSSSSTSASSSSGNTCALFGQQCSVPSDGGTTIPCCNEVPCLTVGGVACGVGQTGCTCHFFVP